MGTVELKNIMQNVISKADNKLLKMLLAISNEYNGNNDVVGYDYTSKTVLSKADLTARALISEQQIKNGEGLTIEELEQDMKNW